MTYLTSPSRERGFGAVAAIIVLVILASLAAAMTRFGSVQHMTSAQDVLAVRALAAARSGLEYGLYRALRDTSNTACSTTPTWPLDLTADTGFFVSVSCTPSIEFHEDHDPPGTPKKLTIYTITATACNMPAAGACPNSAAVASAGYVERVAQAVATNVAPE